MEHRALSDLSQMPLDVGTVSCYFSAPLVLHTVLSFCCLMDFFPSIAGGEEAANAFTWYIGYLTKQSYFHNLNVDFWMLVKLSQRPLI